MNSTSTTLELAKDVEPIKGYVLESRIGEGGYGEVWKARAPGGMAKAIKFVHGRVGDKWAERELAALNLVKQLTHPFLLSLERIEVIDDHLVIVTELADSSLQQRFEACRQAGQAGIPRDELTNYLLEAAEALDYLREGHALQHLDVKPENIFLVKKHVKVADFGLLGDLDHPDSSSVNGLTPKYASPEVFEGRPSRHSDQYSLALVFCEMATGQFPFSGQTSAILASQHLHSVPDLSRLSPVERRVVGRALSKDSSRRFASCSEFVNRLRCRDTSTALIGAPADKLPDHAMWSGIGAQPGMSSSARKPSSADDTRSMGSHDGHTLAVTSPTTRSLPALEIDGQAVAYRPSVFIGIGGTGASVLCRLRQLLSNRFGDCRSLPSLQFLLIDTDPESINAALAGDVDHRLRCEETLLVPLRSGWDYRRIAFGDVPSVNRRWLYNIPRSQRTEGIRPLGRVALLDHAEIVLRQLRSVISAAAAQETAIVTAKYTDLPFRDGDPRVFVVASIAGGTGGGMLVDITYAVRQILAETGLSDDHVCGLLAYSMGRREKTAGLEPANAYSCLEELRYFGLPGHDYPGEPACGLLGFREDRTALTNTYLVEMDGGGADDPYAEQLDRMARYLFLSTATPASTFLDVCRGGDQAPSGPESFSLRTFGVMPLAADNRQIRPGWIDRTCQMLVCRWRGPESPADDAAPGVFPSDPDFAARGGAEQSDGHLAERALEMGALQHFAEDLAARLELTPDKLTLKIKSVIGTALGHEAPQSIRDLLATANGRSSEAGSPFDTKQLLATLAMIHATIGVHEGAESDMARDAKTWRNSALAVTKELAKANTECLRDRLLGLAESPDVRILGAVRVLKRFLTAVEMLHRDAGERLRSVQARRRDFHEELVGRGSNKYWKAQPGSGTLPAGLTDYAHLALEEVIHEANCAVLSHLRSSAKPCLDELYEFARVMGQISEPFRVAADAGDFSGSTHDERDTVQSRVDSAAEIFAAHQQELVDQLDREMQSGFVQAGRRLRDLLKCEGNFRDDLVASMRSHARNVIRRLIENVALARVQAAVAGSGSASLATRLENGVKAVTREPLESCGGARRLLLAGPDPAVLSPLRERLQQVTGESVTTIQTPEREILLCCEAEQISFESVATRLLTSQPNCRELASRLHTRIDVDWS
jgi:serine/threonine protein kinase